MGVSRARDLPGCGAIDPYYRKKRANAGTEAAPGGGRESDKDDKG